MLAGRTILLGVTGGIAAYKSCELTRMFRREGAEVRVVLTPRAAEFVSPLTFSALTGQQALVDEFPTPCSVPTGDIYAHLNLTQGIDAYVIAPCTANTLAKLATGLADNLVTGAYLSATAPVVVAPAMNVRMWEHPATQENIRRLEARGVRVVPPEEGELACGETGAGRLAELKLVFSAVVEAMGAEPPGSGPLKGRRFIVTAGGTREYLDPVRFITNASSGTLGVEVAAALVKLGAEVELLETGIEVPGELNRQLAARHTVRTAFDLEMALNNSMAEADGVVMLAAVADYGPARYEPSKHKKSGGAWQLELAETKDILRGLTAARQSGQVFVGVSLEDTDWLERGRAKAASKAVDLNIAVELGADLPFGDNKLNCALVTPAGVLQPAARRAKSEVALLVAEWLAARFREA